MSQVEEEQADRLSVATEALEVCDLSVHDSSSDLNRDSFQKSQSQTHPASHTRYSDLTNDQNHSDTRFQMSEDKEMNSMNGIVTDPGPGQDVPCQLNGVDPELCENYPSFVEKEQFQSLPSSFSVVSQTINMDNEEMSSGLLRTVHSLPNDYDIDLVERNPYDNMATSTPGISEFNTQSFEMVNHVNTVNKRQSVTLPRSAQNESFTSRNGTDGNDLSWSMFGRTSSNGKNTDDKPTLEKEGIKTKLMSAFNNIRHGWTVKTKTAFKVSSPIWLLGKMYDLEPKDWIDDLNTVKRQTLPAFEEFKSDFISRIWFTYRKGFDMLPGTDMETDTGWGCMLRSGQMMLAQGLIQQILGRDWKWNRRHNHTQEEIYHRHIIKFFLDQPGDQSPLSVQNLVDIGARQGKKTGDWYGPASVAHVLRDAVWQGAMTNPLLTNISIYVAQDCTIYKQDVIGQCTRRTAASTSSSESETSKNPSSQTFAWKPVIVIVPVRLGTSSFNTVYTPCIKAILASDYCIGIIGGKPKHSLYFVGWQDEKLIYLDPHFCQDVVDVESMSFPLKSFHCTSPRKVHFSKIDPSCAIGFFCKNRPDFDRLCAELPKIVAAPMTCGMYPMFVISEGSSSDIVAPPTPKASTSKVADHRKKLNTREESKESEDFVFL